MNNNDLIRAFFQKFNILNDFEIEDFIQKTTVKTLNKFDFLICEGETCKEIVFVLKGTFRSFYLSEKGEEITYCISFPNNFMTAYSSFISGKSSVENIQAITQIELLSIPKSEIEALESNNPNWTRFLKVIAEQQYIELENRIFKHQKTDATSRYLDLIKNQPEYVQQIPLQYLASYLGITQRHLSRIRKELFF